MSRETGDRYRCENCSAELVYEKPFPCGDTMAHSETCCGKQMAKIDHGTAGPTRSTTANY